MSIFEKVYNVLDYKIETPSILSAFHIVSLFIIALFTVFLYKSFKNCSEKAERRIAFWFWIILVIFEIYKQFNFTVSFEEGRPVWDYSWYAFPFQFCSSPLFVLPLIAFLPSGKVREAAIAFMGTFSLFAGLAVCIYPDDVYISTLGIDIQTTVHHGSQVVLGIFFALKRFRSYDPPKKKTYFLSAVAVFASLAAVAMLLNIVVHNLLIANGIEETFNMFYISPYHSCTLPLLSIVDSLVPYPVFLCIYIFGFAIVAAIMLGFTQVLSVGVNKLRKI